MKILIVDDSSTMRRIIINTLSRIGYTDVVEAEHGKTGLEKLGQGGVANPASFKGYIPGFFGQDFRKLTANGDRAEILHWIDHGRGLAVESGLLGRLASRYLDGQAIPMPGYRDQLAGSEKERLADYLLLLNKSGPLPAREIERIATLLNHDASPPQP